MQDIKNKGKIGRDSGISGRTPLRPESTKADIKSAEEKMASKTAKKYCLVVNTEAMSDCLKRGRVRVAKTSRIQ